MIENAFYSIIGIGLIFIILNGAFKNQRYNIRAIINLIVGLLLVIIFGVALFLDYTKIDNINIYIFYISSSFIIGLGLFIYFLKFTRGNLFINRKVYPSSKYYYSEFLYIVYRYKNDLFLDKKKEKYQGLIFKLKKNDFHDEFIKNLNDRYQLTQVTIKKVGKVTVSNKKQFYHCYLIDIIDDKDLSGLNRVYGFKLMYEPIDDFNKQIIYRLILKEPFEIEI